MEWLFAATGPAFLALCGASVVLYVLAQFRPRWLEGNVSIPYVFQLKWNVGPRAFDLQTTVYDVFHRSVIDDVCHHFLSFDQVAWAVLALVWGGWPVLAVVVGLAIAQAVSFGERGLVGVVTVAWALFVGAAWLVVRALDGDAVVLAQAVLVGSALLRTLGHAAEPLPPLVGHDTLRFRPVEWKVARLVTFFAGWTAEFASGVPYRLFASQAGLMAQRFGFKPSKTLPFSEIRRLSTQVAEGGWSAWEETRALYDWHPEASRGAAS